MPNNFCFEMNASPIGQNTYWFLYIAYELIGLQTMSFIGRYSINNTTLAQSQFDFVPLSWKRIPLAEL